MDKCYYCESQNIEKRICVDAHGSYKVGLQYFRVAVMPSIERLWADL